MLLDAELADAVIDMDLSIPHGDDRHAPPVIRSAVSLIDQSHMVGLNNAEILVGTASRDHTRLIACRQLHGNA